MYTIPTDDFFAALSEVNLHHMRLYQGGELIARFDAKPVERVNQYSITKNVLSLLVGMLISKNKLALDDLVLQAFPEYADTVDPAWHAVSLRHLLTMSSGLNSSHLMYDYRQAHRGENWTDYIFSLTPTETPGVCFHYSNAEPYLAGLWLNRILNGGLKEFAREHLFSPLGIPSVEWEYDADGNIFAASGLRLTTDELAKLGLLCLNRGRYEGQTLVPAEWIDRAVSLQIKTGFTTPDTSGYGWYFWSADHNGYRMSGKDSQIVLNLPDKQVSFICNADDPQEQKILGAFWQYIYPIFT